MQAFCIKLLEFRMKKKNLSFRNHFWLDFRGFFFNVSGSVRGRKNAGIINSWINFVKRSTAQLQRSLLIIQKQGIRSISANESIKSSYFPDGRWINWSYRSWQSLLQVPTSNKVRLLPLPLCWWLLLLF